MKTKEKETAFVCFAPNGTPDSMQISKEKAGAYISRRPSFKRNKWKIVEMSSKKANNLFKQVAP